MCLFILIIKVSAVCVCVCVSEAQLTGQVKGCQSISVCYLPHSMERRYIQVKVQTYVQVNDRKVLFFLFELIQ